MRNLSLSAAMCVVALPLVAGCGQQMVSKHDEVGGRSQVPSRIGGLEFRAAATQEDGQLFLILTISNVSSDDVTVLRTPYSYGGVLDVRKGNTAVVGFGGGLRWLRDASHTPGRSAVDYGPAFAIVLSPGDTVVRRVLVRGVDPRRHSDTGGIASIRHLRLEYVRPQNAGFPESTFAGTVEFDCVPVTHVVDRRLHY